MTNDIKEINDLKAEACGFDVNNDDDFARGSCDLDKISNKKNTACLGSSFINITNYDGISEKILLSEEEVLILRLAVNHNGNIINLCNKFDSVKSLFTKGLLELSDSGAFVIVNRIVEMIIKTAKATGCLVVGNGLSDELNSHKHYSNISWSNL